MGRRQATRLTARDGSLRFLGGMGVHGFLARLESTVSWRDWSPRFLGGPGQDGTGRDGRGSWNGPQQVGKFGGNIVHLSVENMV